MNWLKEFANWVEVRADDRDADRALRWITAWERSADYVEELKRQSQVSKRSLDDVARYRRGRLGRFGGLRALQRWLEAKAYDPEARLVLAMTAEFEHKQVKKYLEESIQAYLGYPPDTDFLRGFLSALLLVAEEALGLPMEAPPFAEAGKLVKRCARDNRNATEAVGWFVH